MAHLKTRISRVETDSVSYQLSVVFEEVVLQLQSFVELVSPIAVGGNVEHILQILETLDSRLVASANGC